MTYEVYRYIFIGGAILFGILLLVTVFLFFYLKIPMVIGDLTGTTAKKAIKSIRIQNESSGNKVYGVSSRQSQRSSLTDKISASGSLIENKGGLIAGAMETENIGETEVLEPQQSDIFVIEYDITYIHTDEVVTM